MDAAGSCEVKLFPKRNPLRAAKTERATVWVKRKGKVRLVLVENPRLAFSFFFFLKRGRHECYLIKIQGSALLDFSLNRWTGRKFKGPDGLWFLLLWLSIVLALYWLSGLGIFFSLLLTGSDYELILLEPGGRDDLAFPLPPLRAS